ncbi:MAG: hypothetical protein V4819_15220 [Verrucomicrobiota bacterium]
MSCWKISILIACWTAASLCSPAGERLTVTGLATANSAGVLLSLTENRTSSLAFPAAPADRAFSPPTHVRWRIELKGTRNAAGVPEATALRSLPDDVAWPAGLEMIPERFAGISNGMNPSLNGLDPLGVATGIGLPDYDGDGVSDDQDAFPGDPLESVDTDGDGTGNHADTDDDNDGMPDLFEITFALDSLANDADLDRDGDGSTNSEEYIAGTNPSDGASRFHVVEVSRPDAATVRLGWDAVPGRSYSIYRVSFSSAGPVLLHDGISVTLASRIYQDIPASGSRDFYRLKAILITNP